MGAIEDGLFEDLRGVLEEVLGWQATEDQWRDIDELVHAVADAVRDHGDATLRTAVGDLELASPIRVIRLGEIRRVPPPEPIRERVNRLVHELAELAPEPSREANDGLRVSHDERGW